MRRRTALILGAVRVTKLRARNESRHTATTNVGEMVAAKAIVILQGRIPMVTEGYQK